MILDRERLKMENDKVAQVNLQSHYTGWRKKTGPPAIVSHCKYSENSMTELHGNWWTSAIL